MIIYHIYNSEQISNLKHNSEQSSNVNQEIQKNIISLINNLKEKYPVDLETVSQCQDIMNNIIKLNGHNIFFYDLLMHIELASRKNTKNRLQKDILYIQFFENLLDEIFSNAKDKKMLLYKQNKKIKKYQKDLLFCAKYAALCMLFFMFIILFYGIYHMPREFGNTIPNIDINDDFSDFPFKHKKPIKSTKTINLNIFSILNTFLESQLKKNSHLYLMSPNYALIGLIGSLYFFLYAFLTACCNFPSKSPSKIKKDFSHAIQGLKNQEKNFKIQNLIKLLQDQKQTRLFYGQLSYISKAEKDAFYKLSIKEQIHILNNEISNFLNNQ